MLQLLSTRRNYLPASGSSDVSLTLQFTTLPPSTPVMTSINTLKMGMVRSTSSVSSTYTSPLDLLITSKVSTKKLALILFC